MGHADARRVVEKLLARALEDLAVFLAQRRARALRWVVALALLRRHLDAEFLADSLRRARRRIEAGERLRYEHLDGFGECCHGGKRSDCYAARRMQVP